MLTKAALDHKCSNNKSIVKHYYNLLLTVTVYYFNIFYNVFYSCDCKQKVQTTAFILNINLYKTSQI